MVNRWAKPFLFSRSYLISLLFFLFVVDAIVLWYACTRDYSRTVERAEIVLQKTCISLEERVKRTVVATEAILSNRALRIQEVGIKKTISSAGERARFQMAAKSLPDPGSLWLLDDKADLLLDSTQYPSQPVNFSEREYFPQHRDKGVQLYIGPVVKGKITDKYSFTITHLIKGNNGEFSGIIVAAMETDGFTDFLRNIDIGKGSTVTVFRTDGALILRQPMQDEYVGKNFGNLKLFSMPLNEKPSGIFQSSAIDGTPRFLAYRKIPDLPLLVATGIPVSSVLEQWRRRVIINSVVAGVVFIALLGLSAVVYRTASREEKERAAELSSINEALHAEILTRKQVEEELQKSRDDLEIRVKKRTAQLMQQTELMNSMSAYNRSLIEANLDPIVAVNLQGRITDVNIATERITGHSREELIGTDFSEYFTDPEKARDGYAKAFEEGIVRDYELGILHKDQYVTPVLCNASVYKDKNGKVIGVFAAARDITQQRQLEEQLVQSRKMEAIGTMAGGIAHDFNNILASIVGFTEMAQEDVPDFPDVQRSLKMVLKSAYRAGTGKADTDFLQENYVREEPSFVGTRY